MQEVFPLFCSLPAELRLMIWLDALDDRPGRVYQFCAGRGPDRRSPDLMVDLYARFIPNVEIASRPARTLSVVCRESRRAVCILLPDILDFSVRRWFMPGSESPTPCRVRGVLRFDSSRDIISVVASYRERQSCITELTSPTRRSNANPSFSGIKHLAIATPPSLADYTSSIDHIPRCDTRCRGPECREGCKLDNLPRFVRLFPDVTHLYLEDTSRAYQVTREGCCCSRATMGNDDDEGPNAAKERQNHAWPRIRGVEGRRAFFWEWYLIRDEDTKCPFQLPQDVLTLRDIWRTIRFPYYPELSHLKIGFLQPLAIWRGEGTTEDHLGELVDCGDDWGIGFPI
jgi:hypothetical protein